MSLTLGGSGSAESLSESFSATSDGINSPEDSDGICFSWSTGGIVTMREGQFTIVQLFFPTRIDMHVTDATISSMVLRLSISDQAEAKLKAKAEAAGVDVETYAARQLEIMAAPMRSLKEISGPIADEFARSGMTEQELSDFLEAEKHASRAERRAKRAG